MDKDRLANFAGVLVATLRTEIAELASRAERLSDAVAQLDSARLKAQAALEDSRKARAARERMAASEAARAAERMN